MVREDDFTGGQTELLVAPVHSSEFLLCNLSSKVFSGSSIQI